MASRGTRLLLPARRLSTKGGKSESFRRVPKGSGFRWGNREERLGSIVIIIFAYSQLEPTLCTDGLVNLQKHKGDSRQIR